VRKRIRRGPFTSETTYFDRNYGDVITAVDDKPVKTGDELLDIIEAKKPGERVVVRVWREGREVEVLVVLGAGE
jgi:putative serine protease PepD